MLGTIRKLHTNPLVRRVVLPLLKRVNLGDIQIRHHYVGKPLLLHSFRHKGYWFHGKRREAETMEFFSRVIKPGDCVVEVGGHIGYLSMYFADLVGQSGKVIVFEPGSNNLPYIRENLSRIPCVKLVEKAVSNEDGVAKFYEEELTGQNNSLQSEYSVFAKNCEQAHMDVDYRQCEVQTLRLDSYLAEHSPTPQLLKIDIEGAELLALEGSTKTLSEHRPIVMVEVTDQKQQVFELFNRLGYSLFSDTGTPLNSPAQLDFNVCALHPEAHAQQISQLGWQTAKAA